MQGKIFIAIIHELVCMFLDVSGAKNQKATIPSFTTGDVLIFRQALYKDGAAKITKDLRLHGLLPESVEFLSPSEAGHQGTVCSVTNQLELKIGEMPTLAAAASELGRRGMKGALDTYCGKRAHNGKIDHCQDRNRSRGGGVRRGQEGM